MAPELAEELRHLLGAARAQLEAEEELGFDTVPSAALAAPAVRAAAQQPEPTAPQPAARPLERSVAAASAAGDGPTDADRRTRLGLLAEQAASCTACVLHSGRTKSVFARGSQSAELVFVGEGPGRDEDLQGEPFVGRAGQLLDKMIVAMGYGRDEVYICNVVKCRPPENRTPTPEEALTCRQFLAPQLQLVAPKVIVALGRCAAQALGAAEATGSWRGRWASWEGVPVLPTYHPAFLLRSPEFKRTVWEDLQLVMARLGKAPLGKRS